MSRSSALICLDCSQLIAYPPFPLTCPQCGSQWLEARYPYPELGRDLPALVSGRPFDLWRYREALPLDDFHPDLSTGEGGTPLYRAVSLGMMLGCPNLFIKDERQGLTHSFKDRQAAISVAAMKEAGITEAVLASTGNVAISYSAFAARAGIRLWVFLTSLVPPEKMREVALYGTQVVKVTGTYDQAKQLAAEFAQQRGLYLERGPRSVPSVEAMKTIAFEIAEQLAGFELEALASPAWRAPDWYFQSVSGGIGPLGVQKGFWELHQMGLTNRLPAIACIQADGCAPMVHAWQAGRAQAEPVLVPRTHIATLATGDPGRTYTLLYQRMQAAGSGCFESVTDEETFQTMRLLAKMEGLSVEPAAAVGFAGLIKLARAGAIRPNDVIVVNCTGHTMPVEHDILGEGWAQDVVFPEHVPAEIPAEGLLAALSRLNPDRFARIVIADDFPDARRLVRRILQSQGDFTIYEAKDGAEAIQLARQHLPDLMILDLMMPAVDGFAALDALRAEPLTSSIPVIVVTAKDLTPEEQNRLRGRINGLMQKGEFLSDDLLNEVEALLK